MSRLNSSIFKTDKISAFLRKIDVIGECKIDLGFNSSGKKNAEKGDESARWKDKIESPAYLLMNSLLSTIPLEHVGLVHKLAPEIYRREIPFHNPLPNVEKELDGKKTHRFSVFNVLSGPDDCKMNERNTKEQNSVLDASELKSRKSKTGVTAHTPFKLPRYRNSKWNLRRSPGKSFFDLESEEQEGDWKGNHKPLYYIVDPDKNLRSTSEFFCKNFASQKKNWRGVVSTKPVMSELITFLSKGYHFLYSGHGDGCEIIDQYSLNRLEMQSNLVVLLGCSSAARWSVNKIASIRDIQPKSIVQDYLSSGAEVVVGNLWSVFSIDCNRILKNMAEFWFDEEGLLNVNKNQKDKFVTFKEGCDQKWLNGCALVRYSNSAF